MAGEHNINPYMIALAQNGWSAAALGIQPHETARLAVYEEAKRSMRLW